jgi:hypothetical protein
LPLAPWAVQLYLLFFDTVRLEPDVIAAFPDAETVNKALRYLIEIAKHSASLTWRSGGLR